MSRTPRLRLVLICLEFKEIFLTYNVWWREYQKYAKFSALSKTLNSMTSTLRITRERSQHSKEIPKVEPNGYDLRVMSADSVAELR